ncbi:MAG: VWA domain-containing protein [Akkermansiaceae bacterium]|jgi:Ca-activated chloride channel family protein
MSEINFAYPYVFLLLIPLVGGLVWRWLDTPASIAVSSTTHYTRKAPPRYLAPRHALLFLEALAGAAFIVALARPQSDVELMPVTKEGTDIMLVLDYSNSMDAFDPPSSMDDFTVRKLIADGRLKDRLGVARDQINRFIARRSGDRIGLVIFGHEGFTAVPPTPDHDHLVAYVRTLENSLLNQNERGTNIAGGISQAIIALKDFKETRRTIVLITDGDHTVPDPIYTPTSAAEAAKKKDITIHTVGIGSDDPFLLSDLARIGAKIRFDTRNLEKIASITGGRFFRAKDNKGFEDVMNTIDSLEKTSKQQPALNYQRDLYPNFLLAGIISLGMAFLLRHTLLREIS